MGCRRLHANGRNPMSASMRGLIGEHSVRPLVQIFLDVASV
jgi:hypothetical protein